MIENILLLAYVPLAASLVAHKTWGLAGVWVLVVSLLWGRFHFDKPALPKPREFTKKQASSSLTGPSDTKGMVVLAYVPLMLSLGVHFLTGK